MFNHENGEMDNGVYYSIADFVYSVWSEEKDQKVSTAFDKLMDKVKGNVPAHEDSGTLFDRMQWLWSLPTGEPGYHLVPAMPKAPSFSVWAEEKRLAASSPVIANYWLLAHFFLGNRAAFAETCTLAAKTPGTLTPALARMFAGGTLGKLSARKLGELRAAVAKNVEERLLEPAARAQVEKARAGDTKHADPKALRKRLDGEDGWMLIAEFPDDTAAHDAILAHLAKQDATLATVVTLYEQARASTNTYDVWPGEWDRKKARGTFDKRLAPVIGAAFRTGLIYDAAHKRAASSLVNTLAYLDDDVAMDSFVAAIEQCKADDERLGYVVKALRASKHARALDVLARAAWRFFDYFEETLASMKKTAKQGATLDNMFKVHSHLLPAMIERMRTGDAESERLVDKVCSIRTNISVLGAAYSEAFRQVGDKQLARHRDIVESYANTMLSAKAPTMGEVTMYNTVEACIALAKLAPDVAMRLRPILDAAPGEARQLWLDRIAAALGGLLLLAPQDAKVLEWTERVLANRTGSERAYGPLRGIAESKAAVPPAWITWHVWRGAGRITIGEKPMLRRAASAAMVAIGEREPLPFDTTDEYASKVADADLPAAMATPQRFKLRNVLARVVKRQVRSPAIVTACGELLRDLFRFSVDDPDRSSVDERREGLTALWFQGEPALPELASLLALPHIAGADKTLVLEVMTAIVPPHTALSRLAALSDTELLAALVPGPETYAALGFAAGMALAKLGSRAHAAVEGAYRWRFDLVPHDMDHWIESDPIAFSLARAAAQLPNGKKLIAAYSATDNYQLNALLAHAKAWKATVDPSARQLKQQLRAHDTNVTITLFDKRLVCVVEDFRVGGVLRDSSFTHQGPLSADLDTVATALCMIGFVPISAQPTLSSKKARS